MNDVLTSAEKEAIREAQIPGEGSAGKAFSFAAPEFLMRRMYGRLKFQLEGFLANFSVVLKSYADRPIHIECAPPEVCSAEGFRDIAKAMPFAIEIFSHKKVRLGYLLFPIQYCYTFIELLCGVEIDQLPAGDDVKATDLSVVERRMLNPVFEHFAGILNAGNANLRLPDSFIKYYLLSDKLEADDFDEVISHFSFACPFGPTQLKWSLFLTMEGLQTLIDGAADERDALFKQELHAALLEIPLQVAVILGSASLSFYDLSSLAVGDTLWLERTMRDPLPVLISENEKFHAFPIRQHGTLLVEIQEVSQ